MILYLPVLVFLAGLTLAHRRSRVQRLIGLLVMVAGGAGSLALVVEPAVAAGWALGPIAGVLLARPVGTRRRLAFEALVRRSVVLVVAILAAGIVASKLGLGENPWPLTGVVWFAGAVGLDWLLMPLDDEDRASGGVLTLAGFTGVLVLATAPGVLTAVVAGLAALVPAVVSRWRGLGAAPPPVRAGLLLAAGIIAVAGISTTALFAVSVSDVRLSLAGVALPGLGIVLLAAALQGEGWAWLGPVAGLAVAATSPVLRWAALAAVAAALPSTDRRGQRLLWAGIVALLLSPVMQVLAAAPFALRLFPVALAAGLALVALAASTGPVRALVLPAASVQVLQAVQQLGQAGITRFQLAAAAGAILLLAYPLMVETGSRPVRVRVSRAVMTAGLLMIAVAAHDPLDLGSVAAFLLLIDLAVVAPARLDGPLGRLAESGWPPAVAFSGRVLAVAAAIQASVALGALAVALTAGLYLSGILSSPRRKAAGAPLTVSGWTVAVVSLGCGLAPAIFLRMLHV